MGRRRRYSRRRAAGVGSRWRLRWCSSSSARRGRSRPGQATAQRASATISVRPVRPRQSVRFLSSWLHPVVRVVAHRGAGLPSAVQDAAAALMADGSVVLAGGLTAADRSTSSINRVGPGAAATEIGRLPVGLHDTAAVTLRGRVYLFGGGDGVRQHDEILCLDPRTGRVTLVGHLPESSSDQSAATIGGTAYVVGGYTGSRWLDSVVAWRPGGTAHVVAHLPSPLRYAATTSASGRLVVAGGSRPDGTASAEVLAYQPGGHVIRIGRLPTPTTHAAAASLGGTAYVLGGRGATPGAVTAAVVAVDPDQSAGFASRAGWQSPLSDLAAVSLGDRIEVLGGRGARGTVPSVELVRERPPRRLLLRRRRRASPALVDASNVYAADGAGALRGAARFALPRIYVPNSKSDTVDVIDPRTYRVVEHFAVGGLPQHVVPSCDLKTLYVDQRRRQQPHADRPTHRPARAGRSPSTTRTTCTSRPTAATRSSWRRHCTGSTSATRTPSGSTTRCPCPAAASTTSTSPPTGATARQLRVLGQLLVGRRRRATRRRDDHLPVRQRAAGREARPGRPRLLRRRHGMRGGVWLIDGDRFPRRRLHPHRRGRARSLPEPRRAPPLRDRTAAPARSSVISFAHRSLVSTWRIPGGSPDMGGVSADGTVLWLSGRYNAEVYAIATATGRLLARSRSGRGPHGLCVWPQPGRYSLGHTGIMR